MAAPCAHEIVAFDNVGPEKLEILFGRLLQEQLVSVRGCLSFILATVHTTPKPKIFFVGANFITWRRRGSYSCGS